MISYEFLKEIASESNVAIISVKTGATDGIDLGSSNFKKIGLPKIGLIVGKGIASYDAGEVWHLLDQRYDIVLTKLDTRNFNDIDLSDYTDIILPNTWGTTLSKKDAEKLKAWVENGGTLIAYKNAGKWLNSNELLKIKYKSKKDSAQNISFEEKRNYSGAKFIGGAIFETKLDRSHPISFGYKNDKLPVFKNSTLFIEEEKDSFNNPIMYSNDPLLSGYISKQNLNELKNTSAFKASKLGKGNVIYFTDNTNFRAFWYGTNKLLMNAIFFGDQM